MANHNLNNYIVNNNGKIGSLKKIDIVNKIVYYIVSCFHESFKHNVLKQNNKQKKASVQTDVLLKHKITKTIKK